MRIAHVITRMILGGAQENTLLSCEGSMRRHGADVLLITGPALGPEGSLIDRARAGGVSLAIVPELRRAVHPWRDWRSYQKIKRILREFRPDVVHTHSAKAASWDGPRQRSFAFRRSSTQFMARPFIRIKAGWPESSTSAVNVGLPAAATLWSACPTR